MPEFSRAFSGTTYDRKLTGDELVRELRFMVAAEYEAVQLYTQLADSIDDEDVIKILHDIADEEKVHAGEFLALLNKLQPDEQSFYDKGKQEVVDAIGEGIKSMDKIDAATSLVIDSKLDEAIFELLLEGIVQDFAAKIGDAGKQVLGALKDKLQKGAASVKEVMDVVKRVPELADYVIGIGRAAGIEVPTANAAAIKLGPNTLNNALLSLANAVRE